MSRPVIGLILAAFLIFLTGCDGQSNEDKWMAQLQAERQQAEIREQKEIAELERRFNATYFPPKKLSVKSYTYEIQRFFESNSGRRVVFHAFIRDIESRGNDVIAVLVAPLSKQYYLVDREVVFRVVIEKSDLTQLLELKRREPYMEPNLTFHKPDCIVVANIHEARPIRKYEVYGSDAGEYVEIEEDESRDVLAIGSVEQVVVTKTTAE